MSSFDRLHPAIQHHIVNSLGWTKLRPLQEDAIVPLLDGHDALLLAPTAGGKTEAALFPVYSRMLQEDWRGLTVLYVCPIKALLNNLEHRLSYYGGLLGRTVGVWHGDIPTGARKRILANPPDILLTTPESCEVILTSRHRDGHVLFSGLRVAIVDEVHAFAGDDRGWHLFSLLGRIEGIVGRPLQRLGLSATVGNAPELLTWLSGRASGRVISPPSAVSDPIELTIDTVGTLENAAAVISRLHRGEKRLIFWDSRSKVEQLAFRLRELEVETYVSHGSLGRDARRQAEQAFAEAANCVIVSTSTLELGIDVGDLDRVIQIDAPATVSSFLQRLGRTGRRPGTNRNGLFVTLKPEATLRAAAIAGLSLHGWVDPVVPPPLPLHIVAQQMMALALQEGGITRVDCLRRLAPFLAASGISSQEAAAVLDHMLSQATMSEGDGLLWLGRAGEDQYGLRHFMELFSVFSADPLFSVRYGRQILGEVDPSTFLSRAGQRPILLLAGRPWRVTQIEWARKVAWVEPVKDPGVSRWGSPGRHLGFELCRAMRAVLASPGRAPYWTRRAGDAIDGLREKLPWVEENGTQLVQGPGVHSVWWTFAGYRANAGLGDHLSGLLGAGVKYDNLSITFDSRLSLSRLRAALAQLAPDPSLAPQADLDEAVTGLKFSECLPIQMAEEELRHRLLDRPAVASVLAEPIHEVNLAG
ncbi:MAG: DEAD/DEAH box helicase [Candidatus Eisenbacteria bacterium]|nr:DEAD/DEAH box helicase [Candidatus Eisenbacteria bacterium]